ncbi:MAG: 4-alpha-glucanotransferase, partial [Solirubrobacterales bacterium]|nr:4-alpha-glucanotransferase [Solirubrobacterales bacterium]
MRSAGLLLHPTSLPEGRLGAAAYAFVDWLAAAGQTWWQVLPLGPPDEYRSPYKAASAFACSPALLADPDAPVEPSELRAFRERHAAWIEDWAEYAGPGAVEDQVRFAREWSALTTYARERGVRVFGDVPIYVAPGSADHVAHPELFLSGWVAGAPPDAFTDLGQHWGNPLYDWPALHRRRYRWWVERARRTFELFELARIDHFRGFVACWAIPEDAPDARSGRWRRGPGRPVFDAMRGALGALPLVAEDLGVITPAVERLRDELGLPGMVVIVFGFDGADRHSPHRMENHHVRRVVYTGTHDHDTLRGWWDAAAPDQRAEAERVLARYGIEEPEPWWALIRLALASRAETAIAQAQDVLGLGSEARMNVPGREGGNWGWRLEDGQLTPELAARLRAATEAAGRVPGVSGRL